MSNRLPILQAEIADLHRRGEASKQAAIGAYREAGVRLIEAKSLLAHGQWLPWLKETGIEPRTAQRYMRLANIPADKYDAVSHLGIRAALDSVAAHYSVAAHEPAASSLDEAEAAADEIEILVASLGRATQLEAISALTKIIEAAERLPKAVFEHQCRCEREIGRLLEAAAEGRLDGVDFDGVGVAIEVERYDEVARRTAAVLVRKW